METRFEKLFEELSKIGIEKRIKSYTTLIQAGERVNHLFLIKKGGLVLNHIHPKTGNKRTVNFFIPEFHPIATISHAYVLREPSNYSLESFTNTILIEIDRTAIEVFLTHSEWAPLFEEHGMKNMIEKNEMRAQLICLSKEEMLKHLHTNFPIILQSVPSKYVADFLGISPQWLSKLKHTL